MFMTVVSLAKKAKADRIVVLCKSLAGTGFGRHKGRQRLGEKLEFLDWDPTVQRTCLFKEEKKVRSIRDKDIVKVPRLRRSNEIHNRWPSSNPDPGAA